MSAPVLGARVARALRGARIALALALPANADPPATAGWPTTEGGLGGGRYSPLADIHRANVARLRVAWTYRHGDVAQPSTPESRRGSAFEATPILAAGLLIFSTPFSRVIALDPETGALRWSFDPKIDRARDYPHRLVSRGVAAWSPVPGGGRAQEPCGERIFLAAADARLFALDARSGIPCPGFGAGGSLDLRQGIAPLADPADYGVTSPPVVAGDRVIVGSAIADGVRAGAPSGSVRAFDAREGRLVWRFDTLTGVVPGQSGAANVWSTPVVDARRGLVLLPVGSASPDHYGGARPGANLYASSLVALDAASGRLRWHFQTVHHDLWDYDLAAPPVLVEVPRGTGRVDAVAVLTKSGLLFVLERETGRPVFPVEERAVPTSDVEGEQAWPTQPFPLRPPPLAGTQIGEGDLWAISAAHLAGCRAALARLRNEGLFTPPSLRGTLLFPGTGGGANWSGAAWDPVAGRLFVPINRQAQQVRLEPVSGGSTDLRFREIVEPFQHARRPCLAPPWGELVAIDLREAQVAWRAPAGDGRPPIPGRFGYGPPLATAGGLVFHAGTADRALRAHDASTGALLASFDLPAGLHAGPITYKLSPRGRQLLVVAPGGHARLGTRLGDHVIAFALPDP